MSVYYPQASLSLIISWENFERNNEIQRQKINVLAREVTVEVNSYKEADTFRATLDYKSFPFDPRTIKALHVTVHMQDMESLYVDRKRSIITPTRQNIVFIGFADDISIGFDLNDRTVMIEGRDYTSLFLDNRRVKQNPVSLKKRIDQIIRDLIKEQKSTEGIKLRVEIGDEDEDEILPTLAKIAPDFNESSGKRNPKRVQS